MSVHEEGQAWAKRLRRRGWLLWIVTFVVLLGLTAVVPVLYLDALSGDTAADARDLEGTYYSIVGLAGLVLVFCLYTALKQRELDGMRDRLGREARETEDMRTRLLELSAMFQVSTTLNLQLRLDVILELIVCRVVSALRAQQASIMIYDPDSGALETRAAYGVGAELTRDASRRLGEPIAGRVAQGATPLLINRDASDAELTAQFKVGRDITSALSAPLRVGERCIGVLNVNRISNPEPFNEHHREVLHIFAEHVAAVIDRAEVMEKLGSHSRQLEEENVHLSQVNEMKDVFLSTASHELKTPLTSVIAYAELLSDNEGRITGKQRGEFLRRLRSEADRLMALIEDILDLTRLESGKLTLRPVMISPNDVAHAAVETALTQAEKRGIQLREDFQGDLPALRLDEVKMRQVVTNLLMNAVKFSPDGSVVVLRTTRLPKFVALEVRDQGPGIHPEDAARIFELFGQGAPVEGGRDAGVGIGLHLVKRITELHGGHVGVTSVPGEGSTFWVRLPISLAEPVAVDPQQQAA